MESHAGTPTKISIEMAEDPVDRSSDAFVIVTFVVLLIVLPPRIGSKADPKWHWNVIDTGKFWCVVVAKSGHIRVPPQGLGRPNCNLTCLL